MPSAEDVSDLLGRFVLHANLANLLIVTGKNKDAYSECDEALHWENEFNEAVTDRSREPTRYGDQVSGGTTSKMWALIDQKRFTEALDLVESRMADEAQLAARLGNHPQRTKAEHMLAKGILAAIWSNDETLMLRGARLADRIRTVLPSPTFGEVPWSMACLYARLGMKELALEQLPVAVKLGVSPDTLAKDTDLVSLQNDPEFRKALGLEPPPRKRKSKNKP